MDAGNDAQTAWITGAGSGIGREVAIQLASRGWTVAVSGRTMANLAEVAQVFPEHIHVFPLDVRNADAVRQTFEAILQKLGRVDLAMLNAAIYGLDSAGRFSSERFGEIVDTNYMGVVRCLDVLLPHMLARRAGRILVVASIAGYGGLPGGAAYGSSKAALINMCEALYPELRHENIRLSVVNPGFVDTPLIRKPDFPRPFIMSAEKAASHILRAIPRDKFEIAFPWPMVQAAKLLARLPSRLRFAIAHRLIRR